MGLLMRHIVRRLQALVLVACLLAFAAVIVGSIAFATVRSDQQHTDRVVQERIDKSNRNFCQLLAKLKAPPTQQPQTPYGKQITDQVTVLAHNLGCDKKP